MLEAIKPYLSDEMKIENMIVNNYIVDVPEYQIVEGAILKNEDVRKNDDKKNQPQYDIETILRIYHKDLIL